MSHLHATLTNGWFGTAVLSVSPFLTVEAPLGELPLGVWLYPSSLTFNRDHALGEEFISIFFLSEEQEYRAVCVVIAVSKPPCSLSRGLVLPANPRMHIWWQLPMCPSLDSEFVYTVDLDQVLLGAFHA